MSISRLQCLPQNLIVWGRDAIAKELAKLGDNGIERPIIFTVDQLAEFSQQSVAPFLSDAVGTFLDLRAHAPDVDIRKGLEVCQSLGARSIVALGGGSVLDGAKAVSHFHFQATGQYLPIVALPTTLSGSEFSHYFGITETGGEQRFKRSYAVRDTVPRIVILDPVLLLNTPRQLLLSSAIKGIDHAVEGMRQVPVDHPHAVMAADGVNRFFSVLQRWPEGLEIDEALRQRIVSWDDIQQLQLAAWHCYFSPASVIYGLSHRIGHILGGTYQVPHSVTSCITLAPVIRACAPFYADRLDVFRVAQAASSAAVVLADRISALVTALELPTQLRDFGLKESQLPEIAALLQDKYPVEVADLGKDSASKLEHLLRSLF